MIDDARTTAQQYILSQRLDNGLLPPYTTFTMNDWIRLHGMMGMMCNEPGQRGSEAPEWQRSCVHA